MHFLNHPSQKMSSTTSIDDQHQTDALQDVLHSAESLLQRFDNASIMNKYQKLKESLGKDAEGSAARKHRINMDSSSLSSVGSSFIDVDGENTFVVGGVSGMYPTRSSPRISPKVDAQSDYQFSQKSPLRLSSLEDENRILRAQLSAVALNSKDRTSTLTGQHTRESMALYQQLQHTQLENVQRESQLKEQLFLRDKEIHSTSKAAASFRQAAQDEHQNVDRLYEQLSQWREQCQQSMETIQLLTMRCGQATRQLVPSASLPAKGTLAPTISPEVIPQQLKTLQQGIDTLLTAVDCRKEALELVRDSVRQQQTSMNEEREQLVGKLRGCEQQLVKEQLEKNACESKVAEWKAVANSVAKREADQQRVMCEEQVELEHEIKRLRAAMGEEQAEKSKLLQHIQELEDLRRQDEQTRLETLDRIAALEDEVRMRDSRIETIKLEQKYGKASETATLPALQRVNDSLLKQVEQYKGKVELFERECLQLRKENERLKSSKVVLPTELSLISSNKLSDDALASKLMDSKLEQMQNRKADGSSSSPPPPPLRSSVKEINGNDKGEGPVNLSYYGDSFGVRRME